MSIQEFLETQPLYTKANMTIDPHLANLFPDVLFLHCGICDDIRPFRYPFPRGSGAGFPPEKVQHYAIYQCQFQCTGCNSQSFRCWVRVSLAPETWLQKVGQYPSIADLNNSQMRQYRKVLLPEEYAEFRRAVGLAANGVGIGAFVYLRRIFERLIERAHKRASCDQTWDDELFLRSRIPEKIMLLQGHLPSFLVENKSLYGILSKGIHDLSEDECLQFFSVTRLGIELILEENIAAKEKNEKIEQAKNDIAQLTQKLKHSALEVQRFFKD